MADRTVSVKLIADARAYIQGMDQAAAKTKTATQTVEQQLARQKQAFEQVGLAAAVVGGAILTSMGAAVKAAVDWESAWAGVVKTASGSQAEIAALEGELRGLASVLPATHTEIAAVAEAAGQLGVAAKDVPAFTKVMIDMGESTNLSADQAATSLARFMNVMGTAQGDVENLGSAIVELGNNYATTEAEIVELGQRLSGAGRQVGFTEGEVLGLAAALSSVGIEAEAGGSAFSKVIIDIAASVDEGGDRLQDFADIAGVSAQQFSEQWATDPGAALSSFVQGLADAETQGQSTLGVLADLGITEVRMRDALLRAASASDSFTAAMATGNEAFVEGTALADEAARRYETFASQVEITRNKIVDAAISFGEVLMPALAGVVGVVGNVADSLGALPEPVQIAMAVLGTLTGVVLLFGGTALLAVPKIAELKLALATLGVTAATTNGIMAGLGVAGAAGVAIGGLVALGFALESTRPQATEFADAIRDGANAIDLLRLSNEGFINTVDGFEFDTNNVSNLLEQNRRIRDSMWATFDPANFEVFFSDFNSRISQIGDGLAELAQDDLPAAVDSFMQLSEQLGLNEQETVELLNQMEPFRDAWTAASDAAGESVSVLGLVRDAQEGVGVSAEVATEGVDGVADAMDEATVAANDLYDANQQIVDAFFSAQDAMSSYEQSVDDVAEALTDGLTPAVTDGGAAFDLTEQSGRDASSMLQDMVGDAQGASQAMRDNGASADELAGFQARARDQIELAGRQMGLSEDAARAYADRLLEIPDAVTTDVQANTSAAQATIDGWIARNNNRSVLINVNTTSPRDVSLRPGQVGAYAAGGRIPGYAPGYDDRIGYLSNGSIVGLGGGEYIMPTRMTDKYLHILEQMRVGAFPGYASGGRIAQPSAQPSYRPVINVAAPSGGGGVSVNQTIQPTPGMSEQAVADLSASSIAWTLRGV